MDLGVLRPPTERPGLCLEMASLHTQTWSQKTNQNGSRDAHGLEVTTWSHSGVPACRFFTCFVCHDGIHWLPPSVQGVPAVNGQKNRSWVLPHLSLKLRCTLRLQHGYLPPSTVKTRQNTVAAQLAIFRLQFYWSIMYSLITHFCLGTRSLELSAETASQIFSCLSLSPLKYLPEARPVQTAQHLPQHLFVWPQVCSRKCEEGILQFGEELLTS